MSPELEERIYQSVRQAVMWGTEQDEVYIMLDANGLTGERADAMYRRAWNERIGVIRSEGFRQAVKGALVFAGGAVLFRFFWLSLGAITGRLLVICGLIGFWGAAWFMNGIFSALLASRKSGSVIPDE